MAATPKKKTKETTVPTTIEANLPPPSPATEGRVVSPAVSTALEDGTPVTTLADPLPAVAAPAAPIAAVDPLAGLPQELLDALDDADMIAGAQQFTHQQRQSVVLRRIEIVQQNSTNHPAVIGGMPTMGQLAVTNRDGESEYYRSMKIMLVDPLMFLKATIPANMRDLPEVQKAFSQNRDQIGSRMMWKHNAAGAREVQAGEAPVCSSANGLNPWQRHIGQMVEDPRFAMPDGMPRVTHKIGYAFDPVSGDYLPVKNPCLTCPFGAWLTENEAVDNKLRKPMCTSTPTYIVYSIDLDELLILKGTNATLAAAIQGARPNAFGSKHDGSALPGIMSYFSLSGYYNWETDETMRLPQMQSRLQQMASPEDRVAFLKRYTPAYANRPKGQPSKTHPYVPVFPVQLSVTKTVHNGFNQPLVPQFAAMDGSVEKIDGPFHSDKNEDWIPVGNYVLSPEELGRYLQVVRDYNLEGYRESLMGLTNSTTDQFPQPTLNAPVATPQITSNAGQGFAPAPADVDVNSPFN